MKSQSLFKQVEMGRLTFINAFAVLAALSACTKKESTPPQPTETAPAATESAQPPTVPKVTTNMNPDLSTGPDHLSKATVVITTAKGIIKYKFYSKDAPNTVKRMVELINSGFYNGLVFHRVVPGFVIQGGDPKGNGTGGSGQKMKAEFNKRQHLVGTVAMARAQDPDSADSQFYITIDRQPSLDGNYTVFGQTVEGQDVVKSIQQGDQMLSVVIE